MVTSYQHNGLKKILFYYLKMIHMMLDLQKEDQDQLAQDLERQFSGPAKHKIRLNSIFSDDKIGQ